MHSVLVSPSQEGCQAFGKHAEEMPEFGGISSKKNLDKLGLISPKYQSLRGGEGVGGLIEGKLDEYLLGIRSLCIRS